MAITEDPIYVLCICFPSNTVDQLIHSNIESSPEIDQSRVSKVI